MGNPTLDHTSEDQVLCDSLIESDKDADRILSDRICRKSWIKIRVKVSTEEGKVTFQLKFLAFQALLAQNKILL